MEGRLEELLEQLHLVTFGDAEQLLREISQIALRTELTEPQLAFCSSKLLNSSVSLFVFLKRFAPDKDKLITSLKKRICEFVGDYIEARYTQIVDYLPQIYESSLLVFISDSSALVKEAALGPIKKIVEVYTPSEVEAIVRPAKLTSTLLDEIKVKRPSASVKGAIWELIGGMLKKYRGQLEDFRFEVQDVMFNQLCEQMHSSHPEIRTIMGILKGFVPALDEVLLRQEQIGRLYSILKIAMVPMEAARTIGVAKTAAKLLTQKSQLFKPQILEDALPLCDQVLGLCSHDNMDIREAANELLEAITKRFTESLTETHKDVFKHLIGRYNEIIESPDKSRSTLVITVIRTMGILSMATRTFMGEPVLKSILARLIELSDARVLVDMTIDKETNISNFKIVLIKQKMLISFMTSYSYIIKQLSQCPSESAMRHFYQLVLTAIKTYPKLYGKYKPTLHEALANLIMSLSFHKFQFVFWSKKLVNEGLTESLKIPEEVVEGLEEVGQSLDQAVALWEGWLNQPLIWSEGTCRNMYDLIIEFVLKSATELDLSYSVSVDPTTSSTTYIPSKSQDLQSFIRVTNFSDKLLLRLESNWIVPWIPQFTSEITNRLYELPRISKLYSLLKVVLQTGDKAKYFEEQDLQCPVPTYNMLNAFFQHLAVRQNEFEDELLSLSIELLLAIPIIFVYNARENSLHIYVPLLIKALNYCSGICAVDCLERWIKKIPIKILQPYMKVILPHLSPFLVLDGDRNLRPLKESCDVNPSNSSAPRPAINISKRVLELLGNLGGECHRIVADKVTSQSAMAWDLDRIIKFPMPLLNKKIDIYLDTVIPKILELTRTATYEIRTAAIEFLHAVVVFVIGKCNELQETHSFAKIFTKLFPEILRLASDIQPVPRGIFEPLCKQIVHWMATSVKQEKAEVAVLIDSLLEGAADKSNATLREHCAVCIGEYFDWHIRHIPKSDLLNNPPTIKLVIRKIQSFAVHPNSFKQLAAVLCFDKIVRYLRNEQDLVDLYLMDITLSILNALRLSESSLCEGMAKHIGEMLEKVLRHFKLTLVSPNKKRFGIKSHKDFVDRLFEKLNVNEELCRTCAQRLWAASVPDENPAIWIWNRMTKREEEEGKSVPSLLKFPLIEHIPYTKENTTQYLKAEKLNTEALSAQVQSIVWLLQQKYSKWTELSLVLGRNEIENFGKNIKYFLEYLSLPGEHNAKELRNPIIKLKIMALSNILKLFEILENTELLGFFSGILRIALDSFVDFLLIAACEPQLLDLELCSLDKRLLNNFNQLIFSVLGKVTKMVQTPSKSSYILERMEGLYSTQKIADFRNSEIFITRIPNERLIQLCLGHLGIYCQVFTQNYIVVPATDPMAEKFDSQKTVIVKVIEQWIEDHPQKIKVLIKYVLHLGLPYERLETWLLDNFSLFQHCSELLFDYIVSCWDDIGVQLLSSCYHKNTMLPVLFPVLNKLISSERLHFSRIFFDAIPRMWKTCFEDVDAIVNELKLYQILIGYMRVQMLNDLQSPIGENLLRHCVSHVIEYMKDSQCVIVKKEALLLVSELWSVKILKIQPISALVSPSLRQIQRQYFPIKTADLERSSREAINFEIILDSFVKIFSMNLNWESMQWLFLILRETSSPYVSKIKKSLNCYIQKTLKASFEVSRKVVSSYVLTEVSSIYKCFADPNTDSNIYDNLRWAIARRLLMPLLERCDEKFLLEFLKLHHASLEAVIREPLEVGKPACDLCMMLYFKGFVFQIYEVAYRRLSSDTLKGELHKYLFGDTSQGNELTKMLIVYCHNAKRQYIPGYKELSEMLQSPGRRPGSVSESKAILGHTVQEFYSSSAYGCMCSVILKTQSKEILFNQYLFQANREKGDLLWELLVDIESKISFEVETAFAVKHLNPKVSSQVESKPSVSSSFQQYFTDSLFVLGQTQTIPTAQKMKDTAPPEEETKIEPLPEATYEEDSINKQHAMQHILRVINGIESKFKKDWTQMPQFMQLLRHEVMRPETHINIKIFIMKIIVNKSSLFQPYARDWFDPIINYLLESKEQGKGLHYFSRDLCTMILEWGYTPYADRRAIEVCSTLVNNIIKVLPDKTSYIFHMNVRVLGALIERFSGFIYLNKTVLRNMLSIDPKKESSDLWRLNAMQVLAFASSNNVPLCDNIDEYLLLPIPKSFSLDSEDPLYLKLLENLNFQKKNVGLAAGDTLGRIHKRAHSRTMDEGLAQMLLTVVAGRNVGNLAQLIERIAASYPEILTERRLFVKILGLLQALTGSFRRSVLSILALYIPVCRSINNASDLGEICLSVQANAKSLVQDNVDEHRFQLLTLVMALVPIPLDAAVQMCEVIIPLLQNDVYLRHSEEKIRLLTIQIMSTVYDSMPRLKQHARPAIAQGFADDSPTIRQYLHNIWDTEERLKNDPGNRLIAIMQRNILDFHSDDESKSWISIALELLLGLAKRSSDYDRKIYDHPLSRCSFNKLSISNKNMLFNRSQPMTFLSEEPREEIAEPPEEVQTGVMRATQAPIFTMTLEQSLVLGNRADIQYWDSFYQLDSRNPSKTTEEESKPIEAFKAPDIAPRKVKTHFTKFFHVGSFTYGPQIVEGKIRYNPMGSHPSAKLSSQREQQESKWKSRMQQKVPNICREYRIGELPDIEILYKDLIEPLRILIMKDASIASDIFVSLFTGVYFSETSESIRTQLCHYLGELLALQNNHGSSYQTVNTLHQVFINLIKEGADISLSEAQFSSAEQNALSFQTSILAIEHSILGIYQRIQPHLSKKMKVESVSPSTAPSIIAPGVNEYNRHLWLQLAKLFKQINNDDETAGIYSIISKNIGAYVKNDSVPELQTVLKEILTSKIQAKHTKCLELSQKLFSSPECAQTVHVELIKAIRKERYESLASLSQWEEITNELSDEDWLWSADSQEELSCLLRARVRCESTWERQVKDMEVWLKDNTKKGVLLRQYNYELAMHSLIQQDQDRAIYYIDRQLTKVQKKWSNINSMSLVTMHYLVQNLQKIHEFYECLGLLKRESIDSKEKLVEEAVSLCRKWKDRAGNVYFDSLHTWDDILHSRCLFLDILNMRLPRLKERLQGLDDLRDLVPHFYTQAARAGYKKKLFEYTDRYLRMALKYRHDPTSTSLALTYPIIKLKSRQHLIEGKLMEPVERINKFIKIIEIANGENAKVNGNSIQLLLLSSKLSQLVAKEYISGGWLEEYSKCLTSCSTLLDKAVEVSHREELLGNPHHKAKVNFAYSSFCDSILRQLNTDIRTCLETQLSGIKVSEADLVEKVIQHGFLAINEGHKKATYLIPRLIEILSQFSFLPNISDAFVRASALTPAWIFLPWINQLLAILDEPASEAITLKFIEIVEKYPQPVTYAFRVVQSSKEIDLMSEKAKPHTYLYEKVMNLVESNTGVNAWIEALDGLMYPEHRLRYWLELIRDAYPGEGKLDPIKMKRYLKMCYYDIFANERKFVNSKIGNYNRKFSQLLESTFTTIFGSDFSKVEKMDYKFFATSMNALLTKLGEFISQLGEGFQKLSAFSEWLEEYNSHDIKNARDLIEIPGQYKPHVEPCIERHTKIASINKEVLILGSIRRPKRIELHGTNEKSYYILVKGGEDLRLDERVQQLFSIMNEIFQSDTDCKCRSIRIKQFNVTPVSNRLGLAKWITDTASIKELISKQLSMQGVNSLQKSVAYSERLKWINKLCPGKNIAEQHIALFNMDKKEIVEAFQEQCEYTPWNLLRKSIEDMCLSPEAFMSVRERFLQSYAASCVVGYVLGIGDRHLDNLLIDMKDGEVLLIDFGISFGNGINLTLPELIPFRLTRQIEGVMAPYSSCGIFGATMKYVYQALQDRREMLLDCAEIFIKDPLFDWVKSAKAKLNSAMNDEELPLRDAKWYPRKKIEVMRAKLEGRHPVLIMIDELSESEHGTRAYFPNLKKSLIYTTEEIAKDLHNGVTTLSESQQIADCIIEMAHNPDILGRTWTGWAPHF